MDSGSNDLEHRPAVDSMLLTGHEMQCGRNSWTGKAAHLFTMALPDALLTIRRSVCISSGT